MFRESFSSAAAETLVQDFPCLSRRASRIDGTWVATHAIRNGRDAEYIRGLRLTVEGNRFVVQGERGDTLCRGTVELNNEGNQAQMDLIHEQDLLEGTMWKAIYQINANTLRICSNSPNLRGNRPDEFSAPLGSDRVLILLRRGS